MQIEPIRPTLKAPRSKHLKLKYDVPLSNCAFNFNLRRYIKGSDTELEELLKSLQAQYEAGKKKKDDTIAAMSPKLTLLRSVKRAKGGGDAKVGWCRFTVSKLAVKVPMIDPRSILG